METISITLFVSFNCNSIIFGLPKQWNASNTCKFESELKTNLNFRIFSNKFESVSIVEQEDGKTVIMSTTKRVTTQVGRKRPLQAEKKRWESEEGGLHRPE